MRGVGRSSRRRATVGSALLLSLGLAAAAAAHEPATEPERALTFEGAVTLLSAYYDRGFLHEDDGVVVQPQLEVGYPLLQRDAWSLGAISGGFASVHSEATGVDDPDRPFDRFYEFTYWAGLVLEIGALTISPWYEFSDSPAGVAGHTEEVAVAVAYDDAGWNERFSFQPRLLLARETEGAADGGENGTYLALGLEPTLLVPGTPLGELSLSLPIEVGLSLSDFYEDHQGHDETVGYGMVGGLLAAPLPFLPGDVALELGVSQIWFGDHTRAYNGKRDAQVGSIGLVFAF